jgi:flagellar protein FlaJ
MKLLNFRKKEDKKKEESFDSLLLEVDFFCQLAYMAAIATSGVSRSELFYHASKLPYSATRYFRRVDFVAKMFNHDYSQACRIVGEKTPDPAIKAFLLRFSGALSSGEDVTGFLSRESAVFSESYGNNYERKLDLVKKWADGYVALMLTPALVAVMGVVTMMLGVVSEFFMVTMIVLSIGAATLGAWFLYHTAPREVKNHSLPIRSKEQDFAKNLARLLFPIGGVVILLMLVLGVNLGIVMIVASAFLLPVGLVAMADDRKVSKRDSDIASFLRSVGGTMQAIGATAAEAISRIDFRSLGILKEDVSLLHTRLVAGIGAYSCWRGFVEETGSELINRSVTTFWDGVTLGGEPQDVGNEASAFSMKISLLRGQRSQIASGFTWLTVAMHSVLTTLVVFVYSVFLSFSQLLDEILPSEEATGIGAYSSMPAFGMFGQETRLLDLLHVFVIAVVVVLIIANTIAIHAVSGGHPMKIVLYLALTLGVSGSVFIIVPAMVGMLFGGLY